MLKFVLIMVPVLLGLMWIATHLPRLGIVLGGVLLLSPVWLFLLGVADPSHFRSDGSAAGLVFGLILMGIMAFLMFMGVTLIRTAREHL